MYMGQQNNTLSLTISMSKCTIIYENYNRKQTKLNTSRDSADVYVLCAWPRSNIQVQLLDLNPTHPMNTRRIRKVKKSPI